MSFDGKKYECELCGYTQGKIKMNARTRFLKMFNELPKEARKELVHHYWDNPMSLNIVAIEIKNNTRRGKALLKRLGYEDD